MDYEIEKKLRETIEFLHTKSDDEVSIEKMDPIVKLMMMALLHEEEKIWKYLDGIPQKIVERFSDVFLPREKICATPAITIVQPQIRPQHNKEMVGVGAGTQFKYKEKGSNVSLNYMPIFATSLIPYSDMFVISGTRAWHKDEEFEVRADNKNCVWIGIVSEVEVDSLQGMPLLIKGTNGILPKRISVVTMAEGRNTVNHDLQFATMQTIEDIEMVAPFDAQQSSGKFFSILRQWKESLLNMDDKSLLYITDKTRDRDIFKPCAYPKHFQQRFEDDVLTCMSQKRTLWLQLTFPEQYVVPDTCEIVVNALPVANVDVNTLTLTRTNPIAKLQKNENSFFLWIQEVTASSQKIGFSHFAEYVLVRDFDASTYHNGQLFQEIWNLYNHFQDDYYAFMAYNNVREEDMKRLRETINKIRENVDEDNTKYKFDSGTYVMLKDTNHESLNSVTKISYITTNGNLGNKPEESMEENTGMTSSKLPAIAPKVAVLIKAMGGNDKPLPDKDYHENLRYYTLTNDRLYTRMDIEAFLRKQVMTVFGFEEFKRINIKMTIQGAGGKNHLQRGLYIDLEFKDATNYERAVQYSFDIRLQQRISTLSCISMPIIVTLKNLEG